MPQLVDVSPFCPHVEEVIVCPQRADSVRECRYCQHNPWAQEALRIAARWRWVDKNWWKVAVIGAICAAILIGFLAYNSTVQGSPSNLQAEYITGWKMGDDILPQPLYGTYNGVSLDCDDETLYQWHYLVSMGYQAKIVVGILNKTGETYYECTFSAAHYWVIVEDGVGKRVAYDLGYPFYDAQHFEYYELSYGELLRWAARDQP